MTKKIIHPIILIIIDGWGYTKSEVGNATQIAYTPTISTLFKTYPVTFLDASSTYVGLPKNQVGNSEIGHTCIGTGRVIAQDLVRINQSIKNKSFFFNKTLHYMYQKIKNKRTKIHIIGLCSDGGVHSHINHLIALINFFLQKKELEICIHFIADGRDTPPYSAIKFIQQIQKYTEISSLIKICTVSGRYYSMDRDCRWNRTEAFYKILIENDIAPEVIDIYKIINKLYSQSISDEFITPTRIHQGIIEDNDGIIFFNFRPDRMRQILQAFVKQNFRGFTRKQINNLTITTFTEYDSTLQVPIMFRPIISNNCLGEIIAQNHLRQLRIAETEKYAHVTYFFNGGNENPFPGEDRELIPSPKVKTYDESPNMSSNQITDSIINALHQNLYNLIVVNYANLDMVGHTGNFKATVQAIETIDAAIAKLVEEISKHNGILIITADHGNAEKMMDKYNIPHKSHTINPVPFILIESEGNKIIGHGGKVELKNTGNLSDIAPTILDILKIHKPLEMTGQTLIENCFQDKRNN
jgi:2,3-bisphosphoglycerate-independent phosphoglycerate mutase|uniref:2,3-bisphosphoglycerate-independent phosphoglycerate mutase n=1 Tax=Thorea hispida TaxID=202687 RepID=A0A1C9CAH1_9FLOR|nr:phosphoglycerate mutase [Thorea hispida]AOM65378.1 phosphoglycerate mutase [Thorea hispida]